MGNEELAADIARAASAALLRIGTIHQERGLLHHALTPYLKILACYPDSDEAPHAADQLIAIAEIFEANEQFRLAMSVYDRMERAIQYRRWNGYTAPSESYTVSERRRRGLVPERRTTPFPPPTGNGGERGKAETET